MSSSLCSPQSITRGPVRFSIQYLMSYHIVPPCCACCDTIGMYLGAMWCHWKGAQLLVSFREMLLLWRPVSRPVSVHVYCYHSVKLCNYKITIDVCSWMHPSRLSLSNEYSVRQANAGCTTQVDIRSAQAGRRSVCRTQQLPCSEAENWFLPA